MNNKDVQKNKLRTITYEQWEKLYKPILISDDAYIEYKDWHPVSSLSETEKLEFQKAFQESRVWTEFSTGDDFWVEPKLGLCDRVAIYVTERSCNLNVLVTEPISTLELEVSAADASEFLKKLDQSMYPFDENWPENEFYGDSATVDENYDSFTELTRKYKKPMADIIIVSWNI